MLKSPTEFTHIIKVIASSQVGRFPEYAGYFNNHILVRVNREISGSFYAGELALAKPDVYTSNSYGSSVDMLSVWSLTRRNDTLVPINVVTIINTNTGNA